jgi:hypothetical protein
MKAVRVAAMTVAAAMAGVACLWLLRTMGDQHAGVVRVVQVDRPPARECVEAALRGMSSVGDVHYRHIGDTPGKRPIDEFRYEAGGTTGLVRIYPRKDSGYELMLDTTKINPGAGRQFDDARLARAREVMDRVYDALASTCGPLPPASAVVESCIGRPQCPPRSPGPGPQNGEQPASSTAPDPSASPPNFTSSPPNE